MNTWYKFILNALFSKKREDKDWETTDKEEDVLSNYIELGLIDAGHLSCKGN